MKIKYNPCKGMAEKLMKYGVQFTKGESVDVVNDELIVMFESLPYMECDKDSVDDELILKAAKACHDANRKYCKSIGDDSQPAWTKAEDWQRESAINGVKHLIDNPDAKPEDSHNSWLAEKEADGWAYGEVKDTNAKTHPCFVPYDQLPDEQKKKDVIFIDTAMSVLEG